MKKSIFNFIYTVIAFVGILLYSSMITSTENIYGNVILIPLFLLLYYFTDKLAKNTKNINKKEKTGSFFLSILYSLFLVLGTQLDLTSNIIWTIKTPLTILCLVPVLQIIFKSIIIFINKQKFNSLNEKISKKIKLIIISIILFGNFITFLSLFPGVYGYDAGFQIKQFLDPNTQITTHFSIIYSYILYLCIILGDKLFHSYELGFGIYSFLQMIFISSVTIKITLYLYKKTNNTILTILSALFFTFFPPHTILMVSSAQDVFFSGIFALIVLKFWQYLEKDIQLDWKEIIKFSVLFTLLMIFRNNGKYAIIVALPFIFAIIPDKVKFIFVVILSIILLQLYNMIIFNVFDIYKKSSLTEMVSIPSQQIARVYNFQKLTSKEKKDIKKLYSDTEFEYYKLNELISDAQKIVFDEKEFKQNPSKYTSLYLNLMVKYPEDYLEAFLLNNLGLWYPNKKYYDSRMYHPYMEFNMLDTNIYKKYITIHRDSLFPLYNKILSLLIEKNYAFKIPIISVIFQISTYFHLFIFLIVLAITRKQKELFPILGLYLGLYSTIVLSPVILFRYNYSFILCLPITIYFILQTKNYKIQKKK